MENNYSLQINTQGEIEIVTPEKRDRIGLPHRLAMPEGEMPTFAEAGLKKLGVSPANYCWCGGRAVRNTHRAQLEQMIAAGRAAYALTPQGLRERRDAIRDRYCFASDEAARTRTRNFHRFDTGAGMGLNRYDEKAAAAKAELMTFDADHPEVKVAIEAEKAEAAARSIWN